MRSRPSAASGSRHRARMVLTLARRRRPRSPRCGARRRSSCLHLGTLVHDDIVDGSPQRRHVPTLHVALGMPVALWTADALYAEALHLADAVSPAGGLALGGALRRIADSQVLEALGATTARYWEVVDGKTVSLFEAAVRARRRGGRGIVARPGARRGAPLRASVPVRRRPPGHRRRGRRDRASRPASTPTTSCTRCPPPISWCRADEVRRRLRELADPIAPPRCRHRRGSTRTSPPSPTSCSTPRRACSTRRTGRMTGSMLPGSMLPGTSR